MLASRLTLIAKRTPTVLSAPLKRILTRPKSTYVYEYDKTFWQRHVAKMTKRNKELQVLYKAHDGNPIWWKTRGDRVIIVGLIVCLTYAVPYLFYSLFLYERGSL